MTSQNRFTLETFCFLAVALLVSVASAVAQQSALQNKAINLADWIEANYTKYEYRIPMRDGVKLFTAVYIPKDASASRTYPIMLTRTPYGVGPYGVDNYPKKLGPSPLFARSKYIFAYQDVRGRFMSEGTYVNVRPFIPNKNGPAATDEASDAHDTINWLVRNIPFNSGKVGMWGISYGGFYAAMGMIDAPPALKAVSPQAPVAEWFMGDDWHHNGALWFMHFFDFISSFGLPRTGLTTTQAPREFKVGTPDGYEFFKGIEPLSLADTDYLKHRVPFWDQVMQHPNFDAFWKARSVPQYVKDIKPAVLVVGGWLDAEDLYGALHVYQAAAKNNPSGPIRLVMGPWCHGCWSSTEGDGLGDVRFPTKTSEFFRQDIEFPFFEYYLKGRGEMRLPNAYVYETGTDQWRKYDSWPPRDATRKALYLGPHGTLSFEAPTGAGEAYDEYVSNPAKPVPYINKISIDMLRPYMDADQRFAARRTDVLVYQTPPLNADVTFTGPVDPSLEVSTTGTDADWVVKLIDVYPGNMPNHLGGYEQMVRGDVMRGRFRKSFSSPAPFVPGKITKVQFDMPSINHTFGRGHRIMIQVQSSWFPLVDINPQKFVDIYTAKASDFQTARMRVYHSPTAESRVFIWVLPPPSAASLLSQKDIK
ncbi:MAG: CocE/NonD family hydrolase [Terriglobia bacterium]